MNRTFLYHSIDDEKHQSDANFFLTRFPSVPAIGAEKFNVIGTECAEVVVVIEICILMY